MEIRNELTDRGYAQAKTSLSAFVREAWRVLEPGTTLLWNWHLDLICEHLEAVTRGECHALVVNIPPRYMKLCADSTPVLTPKGWTTHGELRVGDEVFTPSGEPTRVIAVHPKDVADFEVTLTNGERIKCNGEHLWTVFDRTRHKWVTERTEDLLRCRFDARAQWSKAGVWDGRARYQLPEVGAVKFPESDQPLPAYFVGAWLGDGTKTKPVITHDPSEHEVVNRIEALGIHASRLDVHPTGTSVCTSFTHQGIIQRLRDLGLYGNKHIPDAYKFASLEQRLELMAGLIDTDGSCDVNGRITFANSNRRLIDDVVEVTTGLGWKPYVVEQETNPINGYAGGRAHWHVCFNPTHDVPVALDRKRPKRKAVSRRVGIRSIAKTTPERGNCITVEAPDGLYLVGRKCVPTHNSILVSVMWPCWEWIAAPSERYLFASYSQDLSTMHSLARRRIIESAWYKEGMVNHWGHPEFALAGDQNLKTQYENSSRGHMIATSVGGTATGQGGDRVVIDDPVNPKQALSDVERKRANRFFDETLSTRLNDKHEGAFVIIMQRLHMDDLTGHVMEEGGWTHVSVPAEAETDETVTFPSGRIVVRHAGDLLWPEREGSVEIQRVRSRLGAYGWAGQYQQRPAPLEGGAIKLTYLRFWVRRMQVGDEAGVYQPGDIMELPEDLFDYIQSWDTTYWEASTSDYCVGQVWASKAALAFLLDQDRARRDLASTKGAIRALSAHWPQALRKLIERTANGAEVLRSMHSEIPGLVGIKVQGSKEARLMSVLPMFEAGNVVIPHPREASWVGDLIGELTSFPSAAHDDQVDAATQALEHYIVNGVGAVPSVGATYSTPTPSVDVRSPLAPPSNQERMGGRGRFTGGLPRL